MQLIEPFTAHYVFALGVARFLGCAHWVISVSSYHTILVNIAKLIYPSNLINFNIVVYRFMRLLEHICSCSGADCFGYQQYCSLR